jgi:hypothetical protein
VPEKQPGLILFVAGGAIYSAFRHQQIRRSITICFENQNARVRNVSHSMQRWIASGQVAFTDLQPRLQRLTRDTADDHVIDSVAVEITNR